MRTQSWIWLSAAALMGIVLVLPARAADPAKAPADKVEYTFSGPFTHDNLTIFLIHGPDRLKGKILTLEEALAQKKVIVHETKNVAELSIENISDEEVFVQAGDIVKGGQQDRTIASDLIVAAKSGKIPLNSFCVESGRWQKRGGEEAESFSASREQVANKGLKIAARKKMQQQEVWKEVAKAQGKLSKNLNTDVKAPASASSYQLSLENKKLVEAVDAHVKTLGSAVDGKKDVIGYVFAVNGKLNSADIYASHDLFLKLWSKQLRSAAVEAVAELQKDKKFEPVTEAQAKAFLANADKAKASEKTINPRTSTTTRETEETIRFDTHEKKEGVLIRRNVIDKK
jgi:hypothetical protein